jgi:hypothetical protein
VALTAALTAGCGDDAGSRARQEPEPATSASTRDTATASLSTPEGSPSPDRSTKDEMKIQIAIRDQRFDATLAESAASRDLIAQLPLAVDMVDHGRVEKTGPLPAPLSLEGQPAGADPDVGDVGYYAPGNDLVLYYGDQSYFAGIVILGQMEEGAAPRISKLPGPVTTTVEAR